MKLQDFTHVSVLVEGHVEPNSLLALKNVAERGRITNAFEMLVLAKFSQLIMKGAFWNEANPLFTDSVIVSPELVMIIKSLPQPQLMALAKNVYDTVLSKNGAPLGGCGPMTVTNWMQLYTAREATD